MLVSHVFAGQLLAVEHVEAGDATGAVVGDDDPAAVYRSCRGWPDSVATSTYGTPTAEHSSVATSRGVSLSKQPTTTVAAAMAAVIASWGMSTGNPVTSASGWTARMRRSAIATFSTPMSSAVAPTRRLRLFSLTTSLSATVHRLTPS